MDAEILAGKLKKLIVKHSVLSISEADIGENSDLINDFGFDSIQLMRFLTEAEKEFGIEFMDDDMVLEVLGKYDGLKNYLQKSVI